MTWLNALLAKYKIFLILIFSCSLFAGGWYVRDLQADAEELALVQAHNQRMNQMNQAYSDLATAREKVKVVVQEKQVEVIKEVVKYVQNPDRTVCDLDPDWVRLKQSILEAADTRSVVNGRPLSATN